ncbi:NYN domain-containing protein [Methylobacter svalbardensis]|uniref:NYN domain-containing protein n=1 Tax=Methylobacter svalbardensis TaxID=3080016 RepID=UPI0030EEB48F
MGSTFKTSAGGGPSVPFRRVMMFVDGENLVFRYQEMLRQGRIPQADITHKSDVYVWSPKTVLLNGYFEVERATFYTYTTGDNTAVDIVSSEIKGLRFDLHSDSMLPRTLSPRVFWKARSSNGKGVDIQMTIDILTHAYRDNYDILYLVSGDGDYKPVLEEVVRSGKQVYVAALSSGLNPALCLSSDEFFDLDRVYFEEK